MAKEKSVQKILSQAKHIAVVGLSDRPERTSYQVAKYMQEHGYDIIPVNPTIETSLGQKAYPSLLDVPGPIDIVNVFRRSEHTIEIAEQAVKANAKVLWLQLGIKNEEAKRIAEAGGLSVIMDRCIMASHQMD